MPYEPTNNWRQLILERLSQQLSNSTQQVNNNSEQANNNIQLVSSWEWDIVKNDEDQEEIRIFQEKPGGDKTRQQEGLRISLQSIYKRIEENPNNAAQVADDFIDRVLQTLRAAEQEKDLERQKEKIFPVLRSASFPKQKKDGTELIHREHTAESNIFYALDLGRSYALIDRNMADKAGWTEEQIHRQALDNLNRLDMFPKQDEVQGNTFYFFSRQDGYAASRVLNESLLKGMRKKVSGDMGVAIPHQDVMIVADLQNNAGYQILSKLNMDFCMKGEIPISPLPFLYGENGELEPIMVMSNPGRSGQIKRK